MENPYAQRTTDYEAVIGPNTGYYLKYFEGFDAGESRIGWHWPAFFVTSGWFIFRKQWAIGILNLAWPLISLIAAAVIAAISGRPYGMRVFAFALLVLLMLPSILLPVFANALYWRHTRKLIANLPSSVAQVPEKRRARLEREGGTSAGATAGVMAAAGFFYIFILGVLAAIAIPAYQDYTIRAQVIEGLNIASDPKAAVANYFADHDAWPENGEAAGYKYPGYGKYVSSVEVISGTVVITYGNAANSDIAGQRLALLPGILPSGDIVWACGHYSLPRKAHPGPGPNGSDLSSKYLPSRCREGTPDEGPSP